MFFSHVAGDAKNRAKAPCVLCCNDVGIANN